MKVRILSTLLLLATPAAVTTSVGLAVFATFAVKGIAAYGQSMIMTRVGQTVLADLQSRLG